MATEAQINANRENAQKSTGPRTSAGRAASSRNRLTFGLFTQQDYVCPDEFTLYQEFCESMDQELDAKGTLEESCAAEIVSASWRLRRCAASEFDIAFDSEADPYTDETKAKALRSIERARAAAQLALNRAHSLLSKLKKERQAMPNQPTNEDIAMQNLDQVLSSIMNCPTPSWDEIFPPDAESPKADSSGPVARETNPTTESSGQLGSNCKPPRPFYMPPALIAALAANNSKLVGGTGVPGGEK